MSIDEADKYIDKHVRLVDIDDQIFEGDVSDLIPGVESSSGKDSLDIFVDHVYLVIPLDEIKDICILEN
ncbi:MAG: hypothetical protein ACOYJH_03550 [Anaerovoracaceae bacterium]|jgi:hypothetical protein